MKKLIITEKQLSQLINEDNSNEIVAYHGSNANINMFVTDFVAGERAVDHDGPGIYFATSKDEAMSFGKYLYTVNLTPRKLISDKTRKGVTRALMTKLIMMLEDWEMNAYDWNENLNLGLKLSLDDIMSQENAKDILLQVYLNYYQSMPKEFIANSVKLGYDGIIVTTERNTNHIIVYNPNIIKITNIERMGD